MAVGCDRVDLDPMQYTTEDPERQPGEADKRHLPGHPCGPEDRDGLLHDLIQRAKLNTVTLNKIDVVGAQSLRALICAREHAGRRETERRIAAAADLGREIVAVSGDAAQRVAEKGLSFSCARSTERRR